MLLVPSSTMIINNETPIRRNLKIVKRWLAIQFCDPRFLNIISQMCFMVGISSIGSIGVIFAIPYLYEDFDPSVVFGVRALGCFIAFQMTINWLCIKYVDSSYNPFRDGTVPDGISLGQNIYHARRRDENQNGDAYGRGRKDATSVTMGGNNGSVMYVASEMPTSFDAPPKRTAYPYFSWTPCLLCNRPRPPRCHHCPLCKKCILKRDHHCFFSGACVGYNNLRHFSIFLFWSSVGTIFATLHALPYYYYSIVPFTKYVDFFFPIAVLRCVFGYLDFVHTFNIVMGWLLLALLFWAISFTKVVINLITIGKTTFEVDFKMSVTDTRGLGDKLRAVYGNYWVLNFLIPLHWVFKPIDDPVKWPTIKA
ncbi:Zinc finger DHHC-type containing 22 [Mactra antiquata]